MYKPYYVKDVLEASSQKKFTVISTFAGGGGSSTGYRLAGGDVLLINEFVKAAVETYTANFPDTKVLVDDIKNYTAKDFLDMANINKGELDILDGSPPCSAFSNSLAGKKDKNWNKEKTYSDGKKVVAIEDLFYEFIRIAEGVQPKVIIAENVKGITFGKAMEKLNSFINEFEKIGYRVTYKVLNAADYGVPQARERTIFICIREDVCESLDLSYLTINSIFPKPTFDKHISMKEAIGDIEDDEDRQMLLDYLEQSWQKPWVSMLPFNPIKPIKPNNKIFTEERRDATGKIIKEARNPKKSCFNMIRPCPDLPSPTLTQQGQKKGMSGVFHPAENRKLTVKECKRLMAFPDDFVLTGKFDQQIERLGRAVAPLMYKEVARSIYENILEKHKNV
jgi:DNA (cytosine-5)-methyltransferase 1